MKLRGMPVTVQVLVSPCDEAIKKKKKSCILGEHRVRIKPC